MSKPYIVLDTRTGSVVGSYQTRAGAQRKADALDLEYGAVRYRVVYNVLAR